jgi:hypothetical protein
MTWKEFKDNVEQQGLQDTHKIGYIDWCSPYGPGEDDFGCIEVYFKEDMVNIFW